MFENLALLNVNIHGTGNVGALADVSGADIAGVYVQGVVSSTGNAGMIVGYNGGWIRGSYAAGSVSGTSNVGGLVGYFECCKIVASYSTASVSASGDSGGWRLGGLFGDRNLNRQTALLNEWEVVLSWRHEAKTASLQSSSQERRHHQEIPVSDT